MPRWTGCARRSSTSGDRQPRAPGAHAARTTAIRPRHDDAPPGLAWWGIVVAVSTSAPEGTRTPNLLMGSRAFLDRAVECRRVPLRRSDGTLPVATHFVCAVTCRAVPSFIGDRSGHEDRRRQHPGSPPLARGRRFREDARRRVPVPCPAGRDGITPRSRGDRWRCATSETPDSGSPPLARGRQERRRGGAVQPGITPARAGTACASTRPWW